MHADKRCLVIVAHPQLAMSRINAELLRVASEQERVTIHDLYAAYPGFVIDGDRERRLLDEHDIIVLQFPFRWYSVPPLLKLWLDEVLAYGYAYGTGGSALRGKVLQLAISTGRPWHEYRRDAGFTMTELLSPFRVTAKLCGLAFAEPFAVEGGRHIPQPELAARSLAYAKLLADLTSSPRRSGPAVGGRDAGEIKRCVVVGGRGSVGRMFTGLLSEAGAEVSVMDVGDPAAGAPVARFIHGDITAPADDARAALRDAGLVLLAVPEPVALAAVEPLSGLLRPGTMLVQTLSVQSRFAAAALAFDSDLTIVGLNPMFAPDLGPAGRPVGFVVLREGPRAEWLKRLLIEAGARPVPLDAERHDRLTGAAQVLTHASVLAFGLVLDELDIDIEELAAIAPPPHTTMLALLARIVGGSPEVYHDIQASNPHARSVRAALAGAIEVLEKAAADDLAGFAAVLDRSGQALGNRMTGYRALCATLFADVRADE